MAVDITSRYWASGTVTAEDGEDGARVSLPIRRTPAPRRVHTVNHLATGSESIEYLAWRFYRRSQIWWRIADANPLAFPLDLKPGNRVAIPSAETAGEVIRRRRF